MSSFEELKATLPSKWLDYYEVNRSWIKPLMDSRNWWHKTPDDGKRPCSDIIIGAITALEPELSLWMSPFCELNSDGNRLVEVLGLNFDPKKELEKRAKEIALPQNFKTSSSDPELERLRKQIQNQTS
jgi:alanyl-tRNA synthetase